MATPTRPRVFAVSFLAIILLVLLLTVRPSVGQGDILVTGTGVARTCGFNLLARLVISNSCKGCSKTYNAVQAWAFRLLYAGAKCGCGEICSVAGYHLFSLCQDSITGQSFVWGRRRRDAADADPGIDEIVANLKANSSIPNTVATEKLYAELQEAQDQLMKLGLAADPNRLRNASTSAIDGSRSPDSAEKEITGGTTLHRALSNILRRKRASSASVLNCYIDWDDIPMNSACCLTTKGCSALQMREFC